MKIIYIILNVSNLETIISHLNRIGFTDYQFVEKIASVSSKGNPRLNTSVWPGYSSGIIIQTEDEEKTEILINTLRQHNANRFNDDEIIKAFVWQAEKSVLD